MTMTSRPNSQSYLYWVSLLFVKRLMQGTDAHSHSASEFRQRYPFAFVQNKYILSSVGLLLGRRGPSTIVRSVGAIVIDSVKRCAWRARPHVSEKPMVVMSPLFGHDYPAAAVKRVSLALWVIATALGTLPRFVLWRGFVVSGLSVLPRSVADKGGFQAPATVSSSSKFLGRDDRCATALAHAIPSDVVSKRWALRDNGQSSELLSDLVVRFPAHRRVSLSSSLWASIVRLTSSATEMPRRFASFLRYAICGSVNEIICLITFHHQKRSRHDLSFAPIGRNCYDAHRFHRALEHPSNCRSVSVDNGHHQRLVVRQARQQSAVTDCELQGKVLGITPRHDALAVNFNYLDGKLLNPHSSSLDEHFQGHTGAVVRHSRHTHSIPRGMR